MSRASPKSATTTFLFWGEGKQGRAATRSRHPLPTPSSAFWGQPVVFPTLPLRPRAAGSHYLPLKYISPPQISFIKQQQTSPDRPSLHIQALLRAHSRWCSLVWPIPCDGHRPSRPPSHPLGVWWVGVPLALLQPWLLTSRTRQLWELRSRWMMFMEWR